MATDRPPLVLASDAWFFAGGEYVTLADGAVMTGQMYVHERIPAERTQPYPIVMIHGLGQTGTNFEGTADGREGWAQWFVRAGYAVYVVDQPMRGRSAYHPELDGDLSRGQIGHAQGLADRFTAPAGAALYPSAGKHTQWPGGEHAGKPGDPLFDAFFASQVEAIPSTTGRPELLVRAAGAALLDRIGPAILITHSQSGAMGWQIADARPHLVRGIVALEPALAPSVPPSHAPATYGVTVTPIAYEPPLSTPADIVRVEEAEPDAPDLARCWVQGDPVRRLINLAGIPILIVVAEASPQAHTAHCTAKFLRQAGVANEFVRLPDVGIRGNGHMMMLEKNSDEIAAFLAGWIEQRSP